MMPDNHTGSDKLRRVLLAFLVAAFFVTSMLYSFAVPIYEAQDEKAHFEFVRFFAREARLPDFRKSEDLKAAGLESIQTPLYYVFQGAFLRALGRADIEFEFRKNPFRSKAMPAIYLHNEKGESFPYSGKYRVFHLLRLTNVVAGVLILLVIYKIARLILPAETILPVAATGFVVFIPQFTYICSTISNDAFSILFSSLSLYFMLKFILCPTAASRHVALMSASLGLAILSKQMSLFLIPVCGAALLIKGGLRENLGEKAKNVLMMAALLSLIAGWHYARNQLLFGDVFNLHTQTVKLSSLLVEKKTLVHFFFVYFPDYFAARFIRSFWGSFGYTTVWMGWNTYFFYIAAASAGLIPCVVGMLDSDFRSRFSKEQKIGTALMVLAAAVLLAEILALNFSFTQPQGRYIFSCLCCLAILWGLGMDRIVRGKRAHRNLFFLLLTLLFVAVNLCVLCGVVRKAFSPPPSKLDVIQDKGESHILTLNHSNVVGQTFHCDIDDLDQIAVKFHTRGGYRNCLIIFHLKDASDPETDLARIRLPGSAIKDKAYHIFKFPRLEDSRGKDYVFLIEAVDERGYAGISCIHTKDSVYEEGTALLNGMPLPGDLAFITGSG